MIELATMETHRAAWILGVNTLVHEAGVPIPVMPNAILFAAGRIYGTSVLKLLCRFSLTADTCVARTEQAFGRWGWSSLVIGHFLPGVSLLAPPLAGALGMPWGRFVALTLAGGVLLSVSVLGAGYLLRHEIDSALNQLRGLGWDALAGAV